QEHGPFEPLQHFAEFVDLKDQERRSSYRNVQPGGRASATATAPTRHVAEGLVLPAGDEEAVAEHDTARRPRASGAAPEQAEWPTWLLTILITLLAALGLGHFLFR